MHVHDVSKLRGHLKVIGGSMSDDWNNLVANQTTRTLWFFADSDPEEIRRERHAAVDALIGITPGDELEGMIAAQLIAAHNAAMECSPLSEFWVAGCDLNRLGVHVSSRLGSRRAPPHCAGIRRTSCPSAASSRA